MSSVTRAANPVNLQTGALNPTETSKIPLVNVLPCASIIRSSHSGYLLDTHTFLWAIADAKRLGNKALQAIEDSKSRLFLSSASAFEITNKHRLGKLDSKFAIITDSYTEFTGRLGVTDLSLRLGHCYLAGTMDWSHRDPFDRLLVAQASLENLTIITNDAQISAHPWVETIW